MKFLIVLLTLISFKSCAQTDDAVITYHAETRGFYYHVVVNKNNMTVQKNRGAEKGQELKMVPAKWEEIKEILEKIDVSQMENLKSDSTKSHVDAAALATLEVKLDEDNIHSTTFDHGNPPKVLESLVNTILSLSETVE
jgi:heat shock protein HslJ